MRVIRAARALGWSPVAVYSEAERRRCVRARRRRPTHRPGAATRSYLDVRHRPGRRRAGAEVVHPGYGFLSENAALPQACRRAGLVFVGPPAAHPGDGRQDRGPAARVAAEVPVVPGYDGRRPAEGPRWWPRRRVPGLDQGVGGGGGRGIRRRGAPDDSPTPSSAHGRGAAAFGDDRLPGKLSGPPRHIEVQVFADGHGNVVYLGERDCSVQRRHQKLSKRRRRPPIDPDLRGDGQARGRTDARGRLRRCRHGRVPARCRRPPLLPGDEHPHPGRAHRHRAS